MPRIKTLIPTEDIETDEGGHRWMVRLWWLPVAGRMRCVGLDVRSVDPSLPYLDQPPELTERRLRALRLAQVEQKHRDMERYRAVARREPPTVAEPWQRSGRRGRPELSDAWVAAALDVANAARDRGESQVPAVRTWAQEQRPDRWGPDGPDDSTIGRWLQRARRAQEGSR